MSNYDSDMIDLMCSKVSLFEYASQKYDLIKNSSDSYVMHCPLHTDKTPSLSINPDRNFFHCFSCGTSGSVLSFLIKIEKMSFNEAIDLLGKLSGIEIKELKICESLKIYKELRKISSLSNSCGNNKKANRTILKESEIERFEDEIPNEWIEEGINPSIMKRFNIRIDKKSNRIVYPVYDANFNLIGFKGRTRFKRFKEMKIPKYQNYNSIGTTDYFAGMKENYESIKKHNRVIIFEGLKSVMIATGWGYDYSIAAETSQLNAEQVKLLIKLGVKDVIIAFDEDVPLSKIKKTTKLLKKFCNVYCVINKGKLLDKKMSPVDKGQEVFEILMKEMVKV